MKSLYLTTSASARLAFRFVPGVVRALIPRDVIGCYVLTVGERPVYVGRSDSCLRQRLAHHGLLGRASHFFWQPCGTPLAAFNLESAWYHHLRHGAGTGLLNLNHPGSPSGVNCLCPFCLPGDREALAFAMSRHRLGIR